MDDGAKGGAETVRSALLTGGAGFIGSHLVDRLLAEGWRVTIVDNFDPFYEPEIKRRNISSHLGDRNFKLVPADIRDMKALRSSLSGEYDVVVHLAAKTSVRSSIKDPIGYQEVNVRGTQNLQELARVWRVPQFVFASTKIFWELLGHVYSHLYGICFIALRFFTVYCPQQRLDLAIHKFARLMLRGEPVPIYGDGSARRDHTFGSWVQTVENRKLVVKSLISHKGGA